MDFEKIMIGVFYPSFQFICFAEKRAILIDHNPFGSPFLMSSSLNFHAYFLCFSKTLIYVKNGENDLKYFKSFLLIFFFIPSRPQLFHDAHF